jgi:hypothetical protein
LNLRPSGYEPRGRHICLALPRGDCPFSLVAAHWPIIVNLLAGSLIGAWFGAAWATRIASQTLHRVIAVLLLAIAVVLVIGHDTVATSAMLTGASQMAAGVAAGFVIGIVAALLGVAGGELPDPDACSAVRRRHQTRRQFVAGREFADDGRGFRSLRPGSQLHRVRPKPAVRAGDGGRLDPWQLHWRSLAWGLAFGIGITASGETGSRVREYWTKFSRFERAPSMVALDHPPHVTLAVYDSIPERQLSEALRSVFGVHPPLRLRFNKLRLS